MTTSFSRRGFMGLSVGGIGLTLGLKKKSVEIGNVTFKECDGDKFEAQSYGVLTHYDWEQHERALAASCLDSMHRFIKEKM